MADRVGIIDHGKIVAEGTPAALKAEIGRQTVEAIPRDPGDRDRLATCLLRFGEDAGGLRGRCAPRSCPRASGHLAEIVRALDSEGIKVADLRLHAPTLDDVFLARQDARWRAPPIAARPTPSASLPSPSRREGRHHDTGVGACATLDAQDAAPAFSDVSGDLLPGDAARGQRQRAAGRHSPAGLSDRLLCLLCDRGGLHPGRNVLADQHRHEPRRGHRERLL